MHCPEFVNPDHLAVLTHTAQPDYRVIGRIVEFSRFPGLFCNEIGQSLDGSDINNIKPAIYQPSEDLSLGKGSKLPVCYVIIQVIQIGYPRYYTVQNKIQQPEKSSKCRTDLAVDQLLKRVEGLEPAETREICLPTELVIRESTAARSP